MHESLPNLGDYAAANLVGLANTRKGQVKSFLNISQFRVLDDFKQARMPKSPGQKHELILMAKDANP